MSKSKPTGINWLEAVEEHSYTAAGSYLSLIYPEDRVAGILAGLRSAPVVQFKSKDVFRASRLSLLGVSNSHVLRDIEKIKKEQGLSPILLVRDGPNGRVVIADGYHRMCAIYSLDEDAWISCKIV